MIISVLLLIFSFLFEGFISNYLSSSLTDFNILSTLYTLITFVVIYSYFYNKKKYYILLIIFAILIDVVYTNTFLVNVFLFIFVSMFVHLLTSILPNNILMVNIISICSVIFYHIISYIILIVINYNYYPVSLLFNICVNSIIMTVIYTTFIYFVSKYLYIKFDLKQIR